jgi:hypothetical protein
VLGETTLGLRRLTKEVLGIRALSQRSDREHAVKMTARSIQLQEILMQYLAVTEGTCHVYQTISTFKSGRAMAWAVERHGEEISIYCNSAAMERLFN